MNNRREPIDKMINISMTTKECEQIKNAAAENRMSVSAFMREIFYAWKEYDKSKKSKEQSQ